MSGPEMVYFEQPRGGSVYERTPPLPGTVEAIENNKFAAYCQLASRIGSVATDVPFRAIRQYFDALGLTPPPQIIFEANDESIAAIGALAPTTADGFRAGDAGRYAGTINVALTASNRLYSGTHKTSRVVHELGHGTSMLSHRIARNDFTSVVYDITRSGYTLDPPDGYSSGRHSLLDEGRSELLAGQFIAQEYPEHTEPAKQNGLWFPASYVHDTPDKRVRFCDATPAAIALDLLIAKKPALLDTIIEGPTSVEGLRQTAKDLNSIQPGLYHWLGSIPRTYEAFHFATRQIIDGLYKGKAKAPLYAHKQVKAMMQEKLGA